MVVFTCNHCGESLQKPKVEKHYSFVCRRNKFLTCVDCLKDFNGEEYSAHIKCITEEERYAAKGTYKNGIVKKGEVKQEKWSDMIRSILKDSGSLDPKCKKLLNQIANCSNIPRKKPRFMNFIRNTMGGRVDFVAVEKVWDVIEEYKQKVSSNNEKTDSNNQNGVTKRKNEDSEDSKPVTSKKMKKEPTSDENNINENLENGKLVISKKTKKEHTSDENNINENLENGKQVTNNKKKKEQTSNENNINENLENGESEDTASNKFQMKEEILNILNKKTSLSITKLQKKVFKKYKACEKEIDEDKFNKRFNKKLKKISDIVIENDIISIKS